MHTRRAAGWPRLAAAAATYFFSAVLHEYVCSVSGVGFYYGFNRRAFR